MTGEQDHARLIADRIARRVSQDHTHSDSPRETGSGDIGRELSAMRASLDGLRDRLVQIESRLTRSEGDAIRPARAEEESWRQFPAASPSASMRASSLSSMYVPVGHPSQERFGVEEAVVSELVDYFEGEKKCQLEPGGKPCDHCAMCSTRGF